MADAWSYLPGASGDAWTRMCGTTGDAWARLPGTVGDAWERLIETCGAVGRRVSMGIRGIATSFQPFRGRVLGRASSPDRMVSR